MDAVCSTALLKHYASKIYAAMSLCPCGIHKLGHEIRKPRRNEGKVKKFMKSLLYVMAILCLTGMSGFPAHAQEGKTVVALGADLSAEQRATVLGLMGITEEQLAGYEVI